MNQSKDPLGYDVYAQTLWARIQTALNKDQCGQPLGDDPLVVGIFGEWGAGKSYLLNLIYKLAQKHSKVLANKRSADNVGARSDSGVEITIPVFFQPWKYEHEEHLHVPLLMHILDAYAEVAVQAQTSDEAGDQLVKEYWNKAMPWLSLAWRRVLRPATESLAGQFSLKIKLAPEIEELAHGLHGLVTQMQKEREDKAEIPIQASADGHYFYRWHKVIKQLTRPWQFPELLKDDQGQAVKIDGQLRINFVIFIDDLDRCLPEKAVQTLELIKTVFNVESFAFVLALDDEVIERGIGHRYKEYKLQDKKPEMPITGFEYLEKIVHLPFRLPGLTQEQARRFIVEYEKNTADKDQFLWFSQAKAGTVEETEISDIQGTDRMGIKEELKPADLLDLVIASFDAYVPRKLIRTMELLRQVMQVVQQEHGKTITGNGKPMDIRVILALLLIQLFQPELYRLVRRRVDVFPALYGGFVRKELFYPISDIDLWKWVANLPLNTSSTSVKTGQSKVVDALNPYEASVQRIEDIEQSNDKADAQYVRLPLVAQLVEHRAVQRHVFNALRMMKELAKLLSPVESLGDFSLYLSLLSANDIPSKEIPHASQTKDQRLRFAVDNIQRLLEDLTSPRAEVYENIAQRHELQTDLVLDSTSSQNLVAELQMWLKKQPPRKQTKQNEKLGLLVQKERKTRLLRGFQFLAPYISHDHGAAFWSLVSDLGKDWLPDPNIPNTITPDPAKASLYLDVQSMLRQDDRFDLSEKLGADGQTLKPLYLLKNRWNENNEEQEPIPGFVRIPEGIYEIGDSNVRRNPIANYTLKYAIYMARMLTTVDQFAAFVADGGYGENINDDHAKKYWDDQGWAWRHNSEAFVRDLNGSADIRERLERRTGELRAVPWNWTEQRRVGSRAVTGINWFEARAYARWLDEQFQQRGLLTNQLADYAVSLPNEWQWELAARGLSPHRWTWGNYDVEAFKRGNFDQSGIGHVSVPGCFAPNSNGLLDMAGNVFEWQDGLFNNASVTRYQYQRLRAKKIAIPQGRVQTVVDTVHHHLPRNYTQLLHNDEWQTCDMIATRGGSHSVSPRIAACSFRDWFPADFWFLSFGFRVALSFQEQPPSNTNLTPINPNLFT